MTNTATKVSFSLTILGSSSALPTSERNPSAHAITLHERVFLVDCGEGTQMQIRKNKIRLSRIHHIFITHLHGDHTFGIYGLLSTLSLTGRESPLVIYAPSGFEKILTAHLADYDVKLNFPLEIVSLSGKGPVEILSTKDLTVTAIPMKHRIPCFGFIFREKERERNIRKEALAQYQIPLASLPGLKRGDDLILDDGTIIENHVLTTDPPVPRSCAILGDTSYFSRLPGMLKGVDLLYHEATFDESLHKLAKQTGHSTSADAARVALESSSGKLIIGHFSARYRHSSVLVEQARAIFPETYAAFDGLRVEL